MLFNSYTFLFAFLPLTFIGFVLLKSGRRPRLALVWLLLASLIFYAWWKIAYLPLLVASIICNYAFSHAIEHVRRDDALRRAVLTLGVAFNLGLLGYFKYAGFFAENWNALFGTDLHLDVILPLAISFFTFQQIAYLVDVAAGARAERSLATYALFVSFFPQLIAGPIVRHQEMLPQLHQGARWRVDFTDVGVGLFVIAVGLSKKVIIADGAATEANIIFDAAERGIELTLFEAWLGALAYTVQIYFDFSGYSDMAIGLARLFGLRLPMNFNSPYQARSISDFWQRWHMTLSRFLRDYLYIPLGGNRRGPLRRHVNLMITMLLGGLWHGAAWTFVIWGGLHGLYLVVNHAWRQAFGDRRAGNKSWFGDMLAWATTFGAVVVAWVFFRATSLSGAAGMLHAMFGGNGLSLTSYFLGLEPWLGPLGVTFDGMFANRLVDPVSALAQIGAGLAIALFVPNVYRLIPEHARPFEVYVRAVPHQARARWRAGWAWGAATGILFGIGVLGVGDENEFLYFNF